MNFSNLEVNQAEQGLIGFFILLLFVALCLRSAAWWRSQGSLPLPGTVTQQLGQLQLILRVSCGPS